MKINNNTSIQSYTPAVSQQKPKEEGSAIPQDGVLLGQGTGEETSVKKWTFMHYAAGDNNLAPYIESDVDEMERIGSDENTNIVALLDLNRGKGAKTYYITQDKTPGLKSEVLENHGLVNTSDPKFLAKFIIDTVKKFPAEHYMLDIGDHGGGWSGAISDDSAGGWMTTPQIRQALDIAQKETGVKLDIVAFDCCLMATGEVANELKDHTNFMVASQESEGGAGWTYNDVLRDKDGNTLAPQRHSYKNILMSAEVLGDTQEKLRNRITLEPKEFAMKQVDSAAAHQGDLPTMSAFDLSKMAEFNKAAGGFAEAILATTTSGTTLKGLAGKTMKFSSGKDAYHFAELITKDPSITDQNLKAAAQNLMAAVKEVIIHNEHQEPRYSNAHGLNMEIPSYGSVSGKYDELLFNKEVPQWKKAMDKMGVKASIEFIQSVELPPPPTE